VLHGVKAAPKFQTLRDLIGGDSYIDPARLKLGRALGEGAFAKVQLAELLPADGSSGGKPRQVAVKALRQELLQDPEQVQLFGKEVALLRKLRHRWVGRGRRLAARPPDLLRAAMIGWMGPGSPVLPLQTAGTISMHLCTALYVCTASCLPSLLPLLQAHCRVCGLQLDHGQLGDCADHARRVLFPAGIL
jgi:hypothetical protein